MDLNPDVLMEYLNKDLCSIDGELEFYKANVLKNTMLKKFVPRSRASSLDAESKLKFKQLNNDIQNIVIEDSSFLRQWRNRLYDDLMCDDWQTNIVSLNRIVHFGYTGPGASIGALENSFLSKLFEGPITYTSPILVAHFRAALSDRWVEALASNPKQFEKCSGSRISTVPKNKDTNRSICVEPVLNMYYQLGAKVVLESVLKARYNVNICKDEHNNCDQQTRNKTLARIGSIDGSLSTLDLKDASDMISLTLARKILPPEVLNVLMTLRSPSTSVDGEVIELNMLSTMGNGFTFPLMTLLFCSLLRVVYMNLNLPFNRDTFGVYGDDIICLSQASNEVISALTQAGFKVNSEKSYTTGFFRESCGGDYYHGHDVRGIYLKELYDESHAYSVFNRLHSWSLRSNIPLHRTLSYIKGAVKFQPVPRHAGFHEGFVFPRELLSSPKRDENGAIYYRSSELKRRVRRIGDDTINPSGALVSALGGYIVDQTVSLRPTSRKIRVVKRKTPCWDFTNDAGFARSRDFVLSWTMLLS